MQFQTKTLIYSSNERQGMLWNVGLMHLPYKTKSWRWGEGQQASGWRGCDRNAKTKDDEVFVWMFELCNRDNIGSKATETRGALKGKWENKNSISVCALITHLPGSPPPPPFAILRSLRWPAVDGSWTGRRVGLWEWTVELGHVGVQLQTKKNLR